MSACLYQTEYIVKLKKGNAEIVKINFCIAFFCLCVSFLQTPYSKMLFDFDQIVGVEIFQKVGNIVVFRG